MNPYYEHAGIAIYHGDCADVLPQLGGFDLLLTDPPYGLGENPKRVASRAKPGPTNRQVTEATDYGEFDWDVAPPSSELISACLAAAKIAIIWGGNYFNLPPSRCWLVWNKLNGKSDFADCELAWSNARSAVRKFDFLWNGMMRAGRDSGVRRVHPTQKPVELMKWCLTFAPQAVTCLDPFMGSGSTLVACKDEGVKCVGIDREERYCEIAAKRLTQSAFPFTELQGTAMRDADDAAERHLEAEDV